MKVFTDKNVIKRITIAILIVMMFSFMSPTVSQADFGGKLFKPISQFLCAIGDLVIKGLQYYFVGDWDIQYGGIDEIESDTFYIRYSPGIIFSGTVPGLKVNFIDASKDDRVAVTKGSDIEWKKIADCNIDYMEKNYGLNPNTSYGYVKYTDNNWWELPTAKAHLVRTWQYNGKSYTAIKTDVDLDKDNLSIWSFGIIGNVVNLFNVSKDLIESLSDEEWNLYELQGGFVDNGYKESSAYLLQDTVATWYKALRAIALVGLLSVLVYIGIRILISSTGQEKAKYKKMIGDWVAAICILFILQYIMLFITEITERVSNILSVKIVGINGEDTLMTSLRNEVGTSEEFSEMFPQMLMYLVLVIYTIIFTIQYLKRLLYMAFFTMIAPLIALTYPLDKIKDGQAQAFTMWVREYTFNALLQPMHLLLYYIFVSSAMELVSENPLYAVVAIGFLLPAERFFRKMFGFEKATSAGQIGAAAGGALIMNAINKMGQRAGKVAAGKGDGASGGGTSGGTSNSTRFIAPPGGVPSGGGSSGGGTSGGGTSGGGTPGSPVFGQNISGPNAPVRGSLKNGAKTLTGHYINKGNLKKLGKGVGKVALGTAGAATLGTIGLAAGVATGDLGNALKYGAAGAGVGYMGANSIAAGIGSRLGAASEIYKEGALGTEEYNTRNSIKELTNDNDFNRICKQLNINNPETLIRQFHSNGITKTEDIKKAMVAGAGTPGTSPNEVIAAAKIRKEAERYGMKKKDIVDSLRSKGLNQSQVDRAMNLLDQL